MPTTHSETIVVVDDDQSIRTYLSEVLTPRGYQCQTFEDSLSALRWLSAAQSQPDSTPPGLVLSDIALPGMNGMDLIRTVKAMHPTLPVILLSGFCDLSSATDAMSAGATDYLLKPANPSHIMQLVSRHLDHKHTNHLQSAREALRLILNSKHLSGGSSASQLMPIFDLLGLKRFETFQHSRRVAAFAVLLGKRMQLDEIALEALEIGSLLHDVGKSGIPFNILMKPGKLDQEERRIMELHPQLGANLLSGIPGMDLEAEIVLSHHERYDGMGYPRRLASQNIPLGARLFSIADTLDSITADRCYRKGQDISVARAEIYRMSGSQFDPRIVQHFECISDKELEEVRFRYPEDQEYS
jgi:response regulator RpfG family c-di-GMP phosphodiesterase